MVFISIIITAHNRKRYLMQAVDSALNQTLPKDEYEVIVVKNFEDYNEELEKKGVKTIITNEMELGKKIIIGVKEAKGDVISILEDDDLFLPRKLEKVKKIFKNDDMMFYSNGYKVFTYDNIPNIIERNIENEKIINIKEIKDRKYLRKLVFDYKLPINNSRISIRRDIIERYEKYLKNLTSDFDIALFISSALSGKSFAYDPEILTLYRIHDYNISSWVNDFNGWLQSRIRLFHSYVEPHFWLKKLIEENFDVNEPQVKLFYEYVNYLISRLRLILGIYSSDVNVSFIDLVNVIKIEPRFNNLLLFLADFSPSLVKKIIIKRAYEKGRKMWSYSG